MKTTYRNLDGSIFKGAKQLMVVVAVECSPSFRNEVVEELIAILNRRRKHGKKEKG